MTNPKANLRKNNSFLASSERAALLYLARRLPCSVTPDHLTGLGLAGAMMTAVGFVACRWSEGFLPIVVLGLFLNWLGDSLDGTIARHRGTERPFLGYFIDHSADLISQTLIVVGLGVSPYFTIVSALLVLSLYLLMSSYTYLLVVAEGVHRLSYGGMGATEFRILVAAWALLAAWLHPDLKSTFSYSMTGLDLVVCLLSACTFVCFVWIVRKDLFRLQREGIGAQKQPTAAPAPLESADVVKPDFSRKLARRAHG